MGVNTSMEASLIDKVTVDLAGAEAEARADLWADTVRPMFDVSLLGQSAADHLTHGEFWLLESVMLVKGAFGGQLIHRRKRHFGADVANLLLLEIYLEGELHGDLDGQPVHIRPGDIHVLDFAREYRGRSKPTRLYSLVVSHDVIGYDPGRHPPIIRVPGDTVIGRVLRHTLLGVFTQLDRTTKVEAKAVASGLVALLRNVLLTDSKSLSASPGFVGARSRAIRDHIDHHLHTNTLSPDTICTHFNISRATLYRELKADGGLERYLVNRKLETALMALAFGSEERGSVTRLAQRYGFSSTSHFSREFRRKYGFGPSDVIGQAARGGDDRVFHATRPSTDNGHDILSFLKSL